MSKSYQKSKSLVNCSDCNIGILKSKYQFQRWQGRCRSCSKIKFHAERKDVQPSIFANKTCPNCKEVYIRIVGKRASWCKECERILNRNRHNSVERSAQGNIRYHKNRINVSCKDCGTQWMKSAQGIKEWQGRCNSCSAKVNGNRPEVKEARVKNNPNYRGVTPLTQIIRSLASYKEWRTRIFQRDDFTCLICKERGGVLNVDHYPTPFSKLFAEFQLLRIGANNFAPFWDTNNGRTLCKSCHDHFGWRPTREAVKH